MEPDLFKTLVNQIVIKSPLQARALSKHLVNKDAIFFKRAAQATIAILTASQKDIHYLADAYIALCREMITEQVKFKRTGRYSANNANQVDTLLYSTSDFMSERIYALALSQFLWPNHYSLLNFFIDSIGQLPKIASYLEIGPGHGLHLAFAHGFFKQATYTAIDISEASLLISKRVLGCLVPDSNISFQKGDVMSHFKTSDQSFDLIVMNEVLEHLDDPLAMLRQLRSMLSEKGKLFITTCCNAPTIDHVYLYSSLDQIRRQFGKAGLKIELERSFPVGEYPEAEWTFKHIEVNYSALLVASNN